MDQHFKSYEQYCNVMERNIVMEETVYHNGTRRVKCTNLCVCENCGGCKNRLLRLLWENNRLLTD